MVVDMRPIEEQLSVFPVFFKVDGRMAVVVGNGDEALAKARLLLESRITASAWWPLRRHVNSARSSSRTTLNILPHPSPLTHWLTPAWFLRQQAMPTTDEHIVETAHQQKIPANAVDRPDLVRLLHAGAG